MVERICYDGDRFGEVHYFEKNIQEFAGCNMKEQIEKYHRDKGVFGNFGQKVTDGMTESIPENEIKKLNK